MNLCEQIDDIRKMLGADLVTVYVDKYGSIIIQAVKGNDKFDGVKCSRRFDFGTLRDSIVPFEKQVEIMFSDFIEAKPFKACGSEG